jgi:transglutaminase-like putative cysteine protease
MSFYLQLGKAIARTLRLVVYLMRVAGVPAHIVVGYQGGEFNQRDNYLLVHQSDAHAYATLSMI